MKSIYNAIIHLFVCLTALCSPYWVHAQYDPTDYVLSSQDAVNAFKVDSLRERRLVVAGNDITNINSLKNLLSVNGLIIENNPRLASLDPLKNLTTINGELRILNNDLLVALNGFTSLTNVTTLTIAGNQSLKTIKGFPALNEIPSPPAFGFYALSISDNPSLKSIEGFNNIKSLYDLIIDNNASLISIPGFKLLTFVTFTPRGLGSMQITRNGRLADISGFSALSRIDNLDLANTRLQNLDVFKRWTSTGSYGIAIHHNPLLTNFDGLSNLTEPDHLATVTQFKVNLTNNPKLKDPCGIVPLLLAGLGDFNTLVARVQVAGSGFHVYDLITCGAPLVIPPEPVVQLGFNEAAGNPKNSGSVPVSFEKSMITPTASTNVPPNVGGAFSADFGTTPGNYYVESTDTVQQLKNLASFTITGWLNNKSALIGPGGNRIVTWLNNGGDGVELVYGQNGSLQVGIDELAKNSPAVSRANKVTTSPGGDVANWTFFAVTYSSDSVKFYFGNGVKDASLNSVKSYPGRGLTGNAISTLAIGAMNRSNRNPNTYDRMFRGAIDDIQIYNTALGLEKILGIQHNLGTYDKTPPTAPGDLKIVSSTSASVTISWSASTDNIGVAEYLVSDNNEINATLPPDSLSYTFHFVPEEGRQYFLYVTAFDEARNSATSYVAYIPAIENSRPLVRLPLNFMQGVTTNTGQLDASFNASSLLPGAYATNPYNTPTLTNDATHFGDTEDDLWIESNDVIDGLKGLENFTLTGWINNRNSRTDIGGNRIMAWVNRAGDGVDLAYYSDGSLHLGVNVWNDGSPAFSSPNKITTVENVYGTDADESKNWVFFAVTYRASDGQVQFYFGTDKATASLDVTRSYPGRGPVGQDISTLAIATIPSNARYPGNYTRLLKAAVYDFQIWGSALSSLDIVGVQNIRPPTAATSEVAAQTVTDSDVIVTKLFQNYPNPFSNDTQIDITLPSTVRVARIIVHDVSGRELKNTVINERGKASVTINSGELTMGMYLYSLFVDGKVVDVKRMAVTK